MQLPSYVVAAACMRVAHNKEKNLKTYQRFLKQASRRGCKFLAFPECSLQGYTWTWDPAAYRYYEDEKQRRYFDENAEIVPGPSTELLSELAAEHQMYIQFGLAEKEEANDCPKIFNTATLVGPEGFVGKFRKVHMANNPIFTPGEKFHVFQTDLGKVGMIICADLEYPESLRTSALLGAELVANSTAWGMRGRRPRGDYSGYMYETLSKANAMMNQVWLVQSDQIGRSTKSIEYCYGHSCIIDPTGKIVATTGFKEGLASAKIDIREGIARAKSAKYMGHDVLSGRRPTAYQIV